MKQSCIRKNSSVGKVNEMLFCSLLCEGCNVFKFDVFLQPCILLAILNCILMLGVAETKNGQQRRI